MQRRKRRGSQASWCDGWRVFCLCLVSLFAFGAVRNHRGVFLGSLPTRLRPTSGKEGVAEGVSAPASTISRVDVRTEVELSWRRAESMWSPNGSEALGNEAGNHAGWDAVDSFVKNFRVFRSTSRIDMRLWNALRQQMEACRTRDSRMMLDCIGSAGEAVCGIPDDEWLQLKRIATTSKGKGNKKKIFVAFNLHNNEPLMPHFLTELTKFLSFFEPEQVFVSAVESGSHDLTPVWMNLLDDVLDAHGVPHRVIYGDYRLRIRFRTQNRIEFLSRMRNKVLEPLGVLDEQGEWRTQAVKVDDFRQSTAEWFWSQVRGSKPKQPEGGKTQLSYDLSDLARDSEGTPTSFDNIVFINDVYFCVRDVLHLLEHGADMACGIDFYPPVKRHNRKCIRENSGYYDIWVGRDILGRRINQCPPYVDNATLPNLVSNLEKGLPVPVQCCWNGMTVLNAEPFHRGLRFRFVDVSTAQQQYYVTLGESEVPSDIGDECSASEASILCKDLWENGFRKVVMDPSVKVSYGEHRQWFYEERHEVWPKIDYSERRRALAAGIPNVTNAAESFPPPRQVECCPMKTRNGIVGDILLGKPGSKPFVSRED
ncbi:alpha-1,3-mannosyltransferase CMT1 [Chloropicon primus]|uniref:Alpha-1,3-mannosyltransferase CMT1 n=1 Tax=Chloropicon primus TaxID=1764295 RepID=A0A5B8MDN5_9CHLO|nr:alpha-1,3-mannosyltransferase CMT1 [Chloropicon primus]UPQ97752.1 alpha-1,3-mannosyltransferase CMT1 [Chloropicon primus]|eukprot:QDZ18543.1 alpha-1,3-mannosyltransferase CMT1 [Chloropicon primus]